MAQIPTEVFNSADSIRSFLYGMGATGAIVLCLFGGLIYFVKHEFERIDTLCNHLSRLSEDVTALQVRIEGQLSFARTISDQEVRLRIIDSQLGILTERIDRLEGVKREALIR